jgi:hypothetical protein
MTPDHPYPAPDRGPGHPARGSEPTTLVRHGVVPGHVVTAVGVLRGRLPVARIDLQRDRAHAAVFPDRCPGRRAGRSSHRWRGGLALLLAGLAGPGPGPVATWAAGSLVSAHTSLTGRFTKSSGDRRSFW